MRRLVRGGWAAWAGSRLRQKAGHGVESCIPTHATSMCRVVNIPVADYTGDQFPTPFFFSPCSSKPIFRLCHIR